MTPELLLQVLLQSYRDVLHIAQQTISNRWKNN